MDLKETWKITLAQIEVKLDSPAHFKTWFKDTKLVEVDESQKVAKIGVKNSYTSDWLKKKHNGLIEKTLSYVYGDKLVAEYVIDKSLANTPQPKITADEMIKESPMFSPAGPSRDIDTLIRESKLNNNYSFENYVVGSSNKLAHAAAQGVANTPGTVYNPLFIYGGTGLGKTHLSQAIARQILENDNSKVVLYVSSEGFLNDMVKAIRSGKNMEFRQKYRTLDLLIIDDIQFLSKWQETQNEFFNTFNVLYNDKKQIILISDRPPDQIEKIEDRLRSRFQGGMTVDVSQPNFELRLAITQQKLADLNIDLPEKLVEHIAEIVTDNIRELEGALQKIALYNNMKEEDLTVDEVAKILGKDARSKREKISVGKILKCVAQEFNITVKDIKGPRRTADVAFARQVCMYILREDFEYKLEDVAKMLERKDHTTVLHAVDKVKSKLMLDDGFKNQFDIIKEQIVNDD